MPSSSGKGVIAALGEANVGWNLCTKDGRPIYCYSFGGTERHTVEGKLTIAAGT